MFIFCEYHECLYFASIMNFIFCEYHECLYFASIMNAYILRVS